MKRLLVCLLLVFVIAALPGCTPPKTGWHCPDCKTPVDGPLARTCPSCGSQGMVDRFTKGKQNMIDAMSHRHEIIESNWMRDDP